MSLHTVRQLARRNVAAADVMLAEWQEKIDRGDVEVHSVMPVLDALLDLRAEAGRRSGTTRKKTKVV